MAKNSIEAYGASGKTNLLMFDPETLTVVTDPKHPLFDPRGLEPPDDAMVDSIKALGVFSPVTVTKNPETGAVEVVFGRRRVLAAVEANRQLRLAGLETIQIPAWARRLDERTSVSLMISENEIRLNDSPMQKAEKMRKLIESGRTLANVAQLFGCTEQTVTNTLRLLDASAPVRDAVEAGTITATTARQVADLDPEKQRQVTEQLAAVAHQPAHKRAKAQREIVQQATQPTKIVYQPKMRLKAEIQARLDRHVDGLPVRKALLWVLGSEE